MPIQLSVISFDELFAKQKNTVVINYIDVFDHTNKSFIDSLIMRDYDTDQLSLIPSCHCNELKGNFYLGQICHKCNTPVTSTIENTLSYIIWVKQPQGVEAFISPSVLNILLNRYKITKPSVRLVEYIMLPNYKLEKRVQKKNIDKLEMLDFLLSTNNIKRGYNSFISNFFKIIDILEENFNKPSSKDGFREFLLANKDKIFSTYLPFPNRVIFSMESNELGKFIDKSLLTPINVIRRLTGIDIKSLNLNIKQNRVANSLLDLVDFYVNYFQSAIFRKEGLIRQHVSSTRSHFTARAVITSIYGPHAYDEVHIPWAVGINLLREHLLNALYRRGFNYKQATKLLAENIATYSPLLDEIFKEIISSSGNGLPILMVRNPSLHRGSIQRLRITKVKTEVRDYTFSISIMATKAWNGDFDGDELNVTMMLTKEMIEESYWFRPHHNVLTLTGPNEFSDNIKFSKTDISTLTNYFHGL